MKQLHVRTHRSQHEGATSHWLSLLREAVRECLRDVPLMIASGRGAGVASIKLDGDPTIDAELYIEDRIASLVAQQPWAVQLYSEERGYLLNANRPEYVVLLDPIDGTFLTVRGLPGSCMAVSVHVPETMKPIAAVVGDYYSQELYWASGAGAFKDGAPISPSRTTDLGAAFASTCYGKASRISQMLNQKGLVGTVAWTESTGTMLSMVRVGSGQVDACWDAMLGYKAYDFIAGAYIAEVAGAVVSDEKGEPLCLQQDMEQRCKFVIAATSQLHEQIIRALAA